MRIRNRKSALACLVAVTTTVSMMASPCVALAGTSSVEKEETVYVVTGSNGAANDTIVSDHLVNNSNSAKLNDKSSLKDIENVKGDEKFSQNGESLEWNAQGNDIYYRGSTDEATPIQMNVSYAMSGESMTGEEMQGKKGDFVIKIKYSNNARSGGVTVPFVVMSGLMVKSDNYSHMTVSSGKVIEDGEKIIVAGMAAPGLADNMSNTVREAVEDAGLGDEIEISGHTTDFDITDIMTVATCTLPDDMDASDFADLDFDDQINELDKGAKELVKGSKQLYDGLNQLNDKSGDLSDGVDQLNTGAGKLQSGVNKLSSGAVALDLGMAKVDSGVNTMYSSVKGDGTAKNPGLKGGTTQLVAGADQLTGGANQVAAGAGQLSLKVQEAADGAAQVDAGVNKLVSTLGGMTTSAGSAVQGIVASNTSASGSIDKALAAIDGSDLDDDTKAKVKELIGSDLTAAKTAIGTSSKYAQGLQSALGGVDANELAKLKTGADNLSAGLGSKDDAAGKDTLVGGAKKLAAGSEQVKSGADQVDAGAKSLDKGADSLIAGFEGTKDQEGLISGMAKLTAGSSTLRTSVGKVGSTNPKTLVGGANQLANGMETLAEGKNSLIKGVSKLFDGSDKLSDGMSKLYKDGIKKIVDLYNDDLKGAADQIQSSVDAAKSYDNFSGLGKGMDGSVKFVFKTEVSK